MKKAVLILLFIFMILEAEESLMYEDKRIISHIIDPKKSELKLYLKDDNGSILNTFFNLKKHLKKQNKELLFAMNAGMYMENSMPLGLYVEKGKRIKKANRVKKAFGNFYMQPNGIFFITKKRNAYIKKTTDFRLKEYVDFATQSGPMLLIDGKMHPRFMKGSKNIHIRNGVGILKDGRVLFAISKELINFYDFATFFKKNGCKNALYLDGAISDIYLPPKHEGYSHSRFGVMVAEVTTFSP
jgi:uncharacterized protein YigE (DUF2233 family)